MWYILKPIAIILLLLLNLLLYSILFIGCFLLDLIFLFKINIKENNYKEYFNNYSDSFYSSHREYNRKCDNNLIDTFKRYWEGNFW